MITRCITAILLQDYTVTMLFPVREMTHIQLFSNRPIQVFDATLPSGAAFVCERTTSILFASRHCCFVRIKLFLSFCSR